MVRSAASLSCPGPSPRRFQSSKDAAKFLHMLPRSLALAAILSGGLCRAAFAQATVEGHVELPKNRTGPVMTKRYEVVTKGGVLATSPPLGVVYLEGAPAKDGSAPAPKQVAQKDMAFIPTLLPVQT